MFPSSCVIDASVGIKLFLPENGSEKVQALFEQNLAGTQDSLLVPDLFFVECANVLWKKVRRGEYTQEEAAQDLSDLAALGLASVPTAELVGRTLEIACIHDVTTYDACYLALSEMLQVPLVTADARLAASMAGSEIRVLTLSASESWDPRL